LRIDPTNPDRIYTSAPGSLSSDTSWVWHSLDGGRTFKWVVNAAPLTGKVTTCHGGGDSEIAVDLNGRLYFNDLTLVNFSTARSDDFGVTFTCSNTGVPETAVDRQWYTIDGDPLNGGSIYLVNDIIGPGAPSCGGSQGNNVLEMYRSPVTGLEPTAGIEFGPANHVSGLNTCNEGIMATTKSVRSRQRWDNQTVSAVTRRCHTRETHLCHSRQRLLQSDLHRPLLSGRVRRAGCKRERLERIKLHRHLARRSRRESENGREFSDNGDRCRWNSLCGLGTAPLGPATNTLGDLAITGDTVLKYSYSTDQGNTWSAPITIDTSGSPDGVLHNNVFAWINAGDDGA